MFDSKYKDFEYIKTIGNFNEIINNVNSTHFHYICNCNSPNLEVIKYCVENGADFNNKNINKNTPFHYICEQKTNKEVLEYCLVNGDDLNIKNKYNITPFSLICKHNKHLIPICKPYMNEYDYIKTLKECNINWKEYV